MPHTTGPATHAARPFMPEIQALRALAVGLVIAFHLWPLHVPGGFVGVDVFFVISGYLISSHLVREADRTGGVRLTRFYAKRLRRLLPASLLVLAVTLAATALLMPPIFATSAAQEVVASTFYVENLWLAGKAVTYSASNDVASPVQHYWSLSTEEQFYLVWPALVIAGLWLGRRGGRGRPLRGVAGVLALVCVASFVHSVVLTAADAPAAYFMTTTRAWEFGIGAMVALILRRRAPDARGALVLRWLGTAAIAVTAFAISQRTPFPGWVAAVPTLGTAAVIVAGPTGPRDPLERLVATRPVQWLGDVSYAAYLWHWPLIVLAPYALHRPLGALDTVGVLVLTGVLSHLTRRFVEMPFISGRPGRWGQAATFAATAAAMALVAGSAGAVLAVQRAGYGTPVPAEARCLGAEARRHADCGDAFATPPNGPVGLSDTPWITFPADQVWDGRPTDRLLAVVGDSHAQALLPALVPLAEERGYEITSFLQGGCPVTYAESISFKGAPRAAEDCPTLSRDLQRKILDARPSLIVTTAYVGSGFRSEAEAVAGYHALWDEWKDFSPTIVVVADHPTSGDHYSAQCLATNASDHLRCAVPRSQAVVPDPAVAAARSYSRPVTVIDLTEVFCDADRCHPVVGGLPVYFDADHLSATFARTLEPTLAERIPFAR